MRLELIHHDYHSCEEDIVASVLVSYGRTCELMYCHSWKFEYISEQPCIGLRLYEGENDFFENVRLYCGVEFKDVGTFSAKDIDTLLLEGKIQVPFIIYIDGENCPWRVNTSMVNKLHPLLISRVEDGEWYCMDPYMNVEEEQLEKTCIPESGAAVKTVNSSEVQVDIEIFDSIVLQSAEDIVRSQKKMAFFIGDMQNLDVLENEISICHSKIISDLIDRFTYFARRRRQYALFISHLARLKRVDMDHLVEELNHVADRWQIAGKKILKIYCMKSWNDDKEGFCELLKEILCHEVGIAETFMKRRGLKYG